MALIDDFKTDLRRFEGIHADVYDDATGKTITIGSRVEGNPTTGVGRALNRKPLKKDEIEYLLNNDANDCYAWCYAAFPWFINLSDMQKRGIMNMVFQLGQSGFCQFHDLIAAMSAGDIVSARQAGTESAWFKQTPNRAAAVIDMLCAPVNV